MSLQMHQCGWGHKASHIRQTIEWALNTFAVTKTGQIYSTPVAGAAEDAKMRKTCFRRSYLASPLLRRQRDYEPAAAMRTKLPPSAKGWPCSPLARCLSGLSILLHARVSIATIAATPQHVERETQKA